MYKKHKKFINIYIFLIINIKKIMMNNSNIIQTEQINHKNSLKSYNKNNSSNKKILNNSKSFAEKSKQYESKNISANENEPNIIIYDEVSENITQQDNLDINEEEYYRRCNTLENLAQHQILPITQNNIFRSFSLDDKKSTQIKNKNNTSNNNINNNLNNSMNTSIINKNFNIDTKNLEFFINNNDLNKEYNLKNNKITTTKYNIFTFLPKGLFLQFTRFANIYFLFTAIIQSIPLISPLNSLTAIIPLIFVLGVSLIRELIEDYSRSNYDYISNSEEITVLRNNEFIKSKSETLRSGELIIVYENGIIPADMMLIDSGISEGKCYIETSSLDGEKALKLKFSNKFTQGFVSNIIDGKNFEINEINVEKLEGNAEVAMPDADLNHFDGKINFIGKVFNGKEINKTINVTIKEFLLKGSILRNTNWIVGIIIYTGMNNKIILNSKKPKMKVSKIETNMNYYLMFVLFFLIICCFFCAMMHNYGYKHHETFYKNFLLSDQTPGLENFITFFTYFLLLNTMIPISLIVTIEIIKIIQGFFIEWDINLYSDLKKQYCKARTVSINEELGNVNFIFSDKTGTLTMNQLKFKYCIINNSCYEYIRPNENINSKNFFDKNNKTNQILSELDGINQIIPIENDFFYRYITQKKNGYDFSNLDNGNKNISNTFNENSENEIEIITEFWKAIAITNEVTIGEEKNEIKYIGTSPDDLELVKIASLQGFKLINTSSEQKIVKIGHGCDDTIEFDILNALNFSSERKRMSIIIKEKNKKKIIIYTKGADCEILKRLNYENLQKENTKLISNTIEIFSKHGFRTLLVAYREINEKEYYEWLDKLRIEEMRGQQQLIEKYYDNIEKDFELLGGTVVEDKLQDEVPETIKDLRNAGIKIWVLTGDKLDTVENIGKSCNLISNEELFKIFASDGDNERVKNDSSFEIENFMLDFEIYLENLKNKYINFLDKNQIENSINQNNDLDENSENSNKINWNLFYLLLEKKFLDQFCIIIESPILNGLFKDEELTEQFLKIANYASTVLCCRVSPFQKSQVIKKMKEFDKSIITLAIGDGGNDVSMIMEANIGVGIYGEEGTSAAQASDFAIGEFKLLRRLLFFHGRVNMNRISKMILYFFYKNFVFTMVQFFYSLYTLSSGQTLIDDWFITCYNLVFTAFPLCVRALTDIDVIEKDCKNLEQKLPFLYKENRDTHRYFTLSNFIITVFKSICVSGIIFLFGIDEGIINKNGDHSNIWYMSLKNYICILFVVSINLLLNTKYIVLFLPLSVLFLTIILAFLFFLLVHYGLIFEFNSKATIFNSLTCLKLYVYLFLICIFNSIIEYSSRIFHIFFKNNLIADLERRRVKRKDTSFSRSSKIPFTKKNYISSENNDISQAKEQLINNKSLLDKKNYTNADENKIIKIDHKNHVGGEIMIRKNSNNNNNKPANINYCSVPVAENTQITPLRIFPRKNNIVPINFTFKNNNSAENNENSFE